MTPEPFTETPFEARIAELERKLVARDKTIAVLIDRQLGSRTREASPLSLLEQNATLGTIVARKTQELAKERADLEKALSELKLTQARLLQALKMESIGQLAAGIAHEINTPTQFVSTNIDFLRNALGPILKLLDTAQSLSVEAQSKGLPLAGTAAMEAAWAEADVEFIRQEIPLALDQSAEGLSRIATIVSAMKTFTHTSSEDLAPADLEEIMKAAVTIARNEWQAMDVEFQIPPGLPWVPCRRNELGQVILNLVVNAAHAVAARTEPGRGQIVLSIRALDPWVELRVSDNGIGIPETIRGRVFDPFFTTKAVGSGTGQGLAISYDIVVEKHQGRISFESEVGKGTCFIVQLPLKAQPIEKA